MRSGVFLSLIAAGISSWSPTPCPGVTDWNENPILDPTGVGEWLLGDPTVFAVGDHLHMFANEVFHGILHYTAPLNDPTNFTLNAKVQNGPASVRPYAVWNTTAEPPTVHLYFEEYSATSLWRTSRIMLKVGHLAAGGDLSVHWTAGPSPMLEPSLAWETNGTSKRVGNPFVFLHQPTQQYWMYYSATSVHLPDSGIDEPVYLGLASSPRLDGPWTRVSQDPIPVVGGIPGETMMGIGSLKLVKGLNATPPEGMKFPAWALTNRVSRNHISNHTASTISLLYSSDGLRWTVSVAKLVAPTPNAVPKTWKQGYAYGFDTIENPLDPSGVLVFYNGRNGWGAPVQEAVGVSMLAKTLFNGNP